MTNFDEKIEARPIGDYLDALASSAPAPGGGSVAGLVGALAAGLGEMVVSLTRDPDPALAAAARNLQNLRASMMASGAADELAYSEYVRSSKMTRETEEDKARRKAMMQEALQEAAAVPLELAITAVSLLEQLDPIVRLGSKNVLSDAAIGIALASACVDVSLINVRVNIPMIRNEDMSTNLKEKAQAVEQQARALTEQLRSELVKR